MPGARGGETKTGKIIFDVRNDSYDVIIGNPPFGKISKEYLKSINIHDPKKKSKNIFSFFLEKSIKVSNYVSFISPKSMLSAPEFNQLRDEIYEKNI